MVKKLSTSPYACPACGLAGSGAPSASGPKDRGRSWQLSTRPHPRCDLRVLQTHLFQLHNHIVAVLVKHDDGHAQVAELAYTTQQHQSANQPYFNHPDALPPSTRYTPSHDLAQTLPPFHLPFHQYACLTLGPPQTPFAQPSHPSKKQDKGTKNKKKTRLTTADTCRTGSPAPPRPSPPRPP